MFAAFARARVRVTCLVGCLGLALIAPVWAADSINPEGELTLARAVDAAIRANPDLMASAFELSAAQARIVQAGLRPNPTVSAELENALSHRLYVETPRDQVRMYMYLFDDPYYVWFRPQVKLVGFVRKDLSDHYQQRPDPAELLEDHRDRQSQQAGGVVRQQ